MEVKSKSYGEIITLDHIPGSEVLLQNADTVCILFKYFVTLFII